MKCAHKNLNTNIHIKTIHNSQRPEITKIFINGECMNKLWYIHTTENCLAIKRNGALIHATAWMNLKKNAK